MYLNFYNLKKQPFHITPDPEFLYLSPSHKEAMSAIIYGISERKGFIAITGAVGVGKTTILRSYLETAERKHLKLVYIFNARLTFKELVRSIYQELGLQVEHAGTLELVNRLYEELIKEYKEGNTVVLIVDEAQNMPIDTLESLRMLSNLETSRDKLIQIVLVGQPEFEATLNLDRLRQLKQRIAIKATIKALSEKESLEYLNYRIRMAGGNTNMIFSSAAMKKIILKSRGIPRRLNILSDNALITGFGYQKKPVNSKIVSEIIKDLDGKAKKKLSRKWIPVAVSVLVVAVGLGIAAQYRTLVSDFFRLPFQKPAQPESNTPGPQKTATNISAGMGDSKPTVTSVQDTVRTEQTSPRTYPVPNEQTQRTASAIKRSTEKRKTVTQGDTLTKLANEIYGKADGEIIGAVQGKNPQITNPNLIQSGSTIIFPDLPQQNKLETN